MLIVLWFSCCFLRLDSRSLFRTLLLEPTLRSRKRITSVQVSDLCSGFPLWQRMDFPILFHRVYFEARRWFWSAVLLMTCSIWSIRSSGIAQFNILKIDSKKQSFKKREKIPRKLDIFSQLSFLLNEGWNVFFSLYWFRYVSTLHYSEVVLVLLTSSFLQFLVCSLIFYSYLFWFYGVILTQFQFELGQTVVFSCCLL